MSKRLSNDPGAIYARGYNAGRRSVHKRADMALNIAKAWKRKALYSSPIGLCATCRLWRRGGLETKWGKCSAINHGALDLSNAWGMNGEEIITQQGFGCINHQPLPSPKDKEGGE